jgi:thioredoxin reductase
LVDAGAQRNRRSAAMHGYLTRDGIAPAGFLDLARRELGAYPSVELRSVEAVEAAQAGDAFVVRLADGTAPLARTLLIATGVVDDVPVIEGIDELYGRSVHHCPYCDGWEHRDEPIAVFGCGEHAAKYAMGMTTWNRDIVLCTNGPHLYEESLLAELARHGIGVRVERVLRLEGRDGRLERVVFDGGEPLERKALFFCTAQRQGSGFAAHFGARFTPHGAVQTGKAEATAIPGLYVAGDASKDAQLVIVAAAEGAEAAIAINTELTKRDLAAG